MNAITLNSDKLIHALKDSPCTSFWLKQAINDVGKRDIVDALSDVEMLATILKAKYDEMTTR